MMHTDEHVDKLTNAEGATTTATEDIKVVMEQDARVRDRREAQCYLYCAEQAIRHRSKESETANSIRNVRKKLEGET